LGQIYPVSRVLPCLYQETYGAFDPPNLGRDALLKMTDFSLRLTFERIS